MDERLFKLDLYLKDHTFNRDEIADLFSVTTRQLTRLLNKWQDEGILTYNSGIGRGNTSEIIFNVDIEKEFITYLIRNIDQYTMEALQDIIDYPMDDDTRKAIKVCIEESLYGKTESDLSEYYVDYLYRMPRNIHPLESMDISLATVLLNIGDRLYHIVDGEIHNHLVLFDEWQENELIIHLRRNIRFSNGDMLFAADVVDCIKGVVEKRQHSSMNQVIAVEEIDHYKLKISFQERMDVIKLILSQEFATIYKVRDGDIYYTGPYVIESQDDDLIKLKLNPYYFGDTPDITQLLLINDNEKYMAYFENKDLMTKYTHQSFSFNFILFNPKSNITLDERLKIKQTLEAYNKDNTIEITPFLNTLKMVKLIGSKVSTEETFRLIKRMCHSFEIVDMTLEDYIQTDISTLDVDAIYMNESVPEDYMYYDLLINGKYAEWYRAHAESQHFMYIYNHKHKAYWRIIEDKYKRYVERNCFMIEMERFYKSFHMPQNFENITTNPYGVINHRSIIMKNEVALND